MNDQQKLNINEAASRYISTKGETEFTELYRSLLAQYRKKLAYWSSSTFMANNHDITELFDEILLKTLDVIETNGGDFVKLFHLSLNRRYKSLLRKLTVRRKFEQYEMDSEEDEKAATFDIADEFNLEEQITTKKKADQRQLIDSLLNGADESTTAIVETFLAHPKPTATAIAKELGYHHSKVTRALSRLQAKYSTKQFGDYTDYLIAL